MAHTNRQRGAAPGPKVATLGYHEVTKDSLATGFQRPGALPFTLTPGAFRLQLDEIARLPQGPVLVTEVRFDEPGHHLLLTFDDGGKSAVRAGDELSRRGWRGHFFVVTGRIGSRTFMDWEEVRYLRSCGHIVGSHSHTHPDIFRELSPAAMREEWRRSTSVIADRLGEPCRTASVPGGEISPVVLEIAAEEGIDALFTVEPELYPRRVGSCRVLGRYLVKQDTTLAQLGELIRFRRWGRALAVRRLKNLGRRALPPLYRMLVARRTAEWE